MGGNVQAFGFSSEEIQAKIKEATDLLPINEFKRIQISASGTVKSGFYDIYNIQSNIHLDLFNEGKENRMFVFSNSDKSIVKGTKIVTVGNASSQFIDLNNGTTFNVGVHTIDVSNAIVEFYEISPNKFGIVYGQGLLINNVVNSAKALEQINAATPQTFFNDVLKRQDANGNFLKYLVTEDVTLTFTNANNVATANIDLKANETVDWFNTSSFRVDKQPEAVPNKWNDITDNGVYIATNAPNQEVFKADARLKFTNATSILVGNANQLPIKDKEEMLLWNGGTSALYFDGIAGSSANISPNQVVRLKRTVGGPNEFEIVPVGLPTTTTVVTPTPYSEAALSSGAKRTSNTSIFISIPNDSDLKTMTVNFRDYRTVYDNPIRDTGVQAFNKTELLTGKTGWTYTGSVSIGGQVYSRNQKEFSMDSTDYIYYVNARFADGGVYLIFQDNHFNSPGPVNNYGGYESLTVNWEDVTITQAVGVQASNPTDTDTSKVLVNSGDGTHGIWTKLPEGTQANIETSNTDKKLYSGEDINKATNKLNENLGIPKNFIANYVTAGSYGTDPSKIGHSFSLVDKKLYRAKVATITVNSDPSANTAEWEPMVYGTNNSSTFQMVTTTKDQGDIWDTGIDGYRVRVSGGQLQINKSATLDNLFGLASFTGANGNGTPSSTVPRRISLAGNAAIFFDTWIDSSLVVVSGGSEWYAFTEETTGRSYEVYFRPINATYANSILTFIKR